MPACGLRRGSKGGPSWPVFINTDPRPSRGAKPRGADDAELLRHGLIRLAREEEERSRRGTSRGARDASHDDQRRQAGASRTVSSFPLWCKGSKRRQEHQAKVAISVQQDQDQEDCKMEVIVEPKTASPPELCAGED